MSDLPKYEKWIARHLPGVYARRQEARARAEAAALSTKLSTYRGGVATRLSTTWNSGDWSYVGGSLVDRHSLSSMRDRGRKAYRDNPVARALVDVETENIVAEGFTLHARTDSPEFNAEVEERWPAFLDQADITGRHTASSLQQLMWKGPRLDGDGGFVLVDRFGQSKLQYIPADRIKNPASMADPSLIEGVEVDETMRPTAFHVESIDANGVTKPERIPAENFVYIAHVDYGVPLAVRGMSCFGCVFPLLDVLDGIVDATATATRLQAAIGLVFKKPSPSSAIANLPYMTNSQGEQQRVMTIENGSLCVTGDDSSIEGVHSTQPLPQLPEFIRTLNRIIDNAFGMPIEIASRDLSQVNFSGGRIGLLGYYRRCRAWQMWLAAKSLSRIYRWWLSRELARGRFTNTPPGWREPGRYAEWTAHDFRGRQWDYTDPLKEAQSRHLEVAVGISDEFAAAAEIGRDYEDILIRRAEAKRLRAKYGVDDPPLPGSTRDVGSGAAVQPPNAEADQTPGATNDGTENA